ncbi:uncharacterized protein ATNIH1004_007695 [Aspergillus tanneri]|uniref:Uncharacterized protein n=1 Tax=Aspergillus tanneri TaxID=1220188 RepID=A0A5M9MH17_9EURO|nr:uncharacterized protein ATNIH1004_007695 [Aspergillus tanneri]KAA8646268.1 hypothetical protein ATNIH1004_007695 [Aspergillus tanneri]
MALRTSADNAEDVAAGFTIFREPLPEHATEITGLIADLYSISTSLKKLEDLTNDRKYRHNLAAAHPDLELVRTSLKYTLEDIVDFFGDLEERRGPSRDVYKHTWQDLCAFFREESQDSLSTRLAKYKAFLNELEDLLKDQYPDASLIAGLRSNIRGLLVHQNNRLALQLGSISLSAPSSASSNSAEPGSPASGRRPRNRRSYERQRPPLVSQSPLSPSSGTSSDIPPSAPDIPCSPVTSSATSQSLGSNFPTDHWARRVFLEEHPTTAIPYIGESSKCLGDAHPGAKRWLYDEGFEELLQLAFNSDSDFRVSLSSDYYCLPLNLLEIVRVGSCLQLCRRRRGGYELVLWANLKFSTLEEMVLFFCTFLALRSQDAGRPVERIRDYELDDEVELFGGQIVDDNFLHALRIYRDNISGVVRLQASVHKGEMKRAPVWTAFITPHIGVRGWIRRVDSKAVLLRELRPVILTSADYNAPRTPKGEHILKFTNHSDARGFLKTIEELRQLERS